ncbi:hypothetical protein Prudu_008541, partial [Prunus dulcis]
ERNPAILGAKQGQGEVSSAFDAWIIAEACDCTDSSAGSHHHNLALPQQSSPPKFRLRAITAIGST